MIINKTWAMPNKNTFEILPINQLIKRYLSDSCVSIDCFANRNKLASITNDLDEAYDTDFNMDAIDFLTSFENQSVDLVLFDPPYSPRQVSECYKRLNMTVDKTTTQASYWGNLKKQIARITKPNGTVISCAWNSGGIGKKLGFRQIEILLVAHGGWHNDTIVVVERMEK